jgi:hypothetical protein
MASATAYERRQAVAVTCEYCQTNPGHPCTSWRSQKTTTTHMLRVYEWRRECKRQEARTTDGGE